VLEPRFLCVEGDAVSLCRALSHGIFEGERSVESARASWMLRSCCLVGCLGNWNWDCARAGELTATEIWGIVTSQASSETTNTQLSSHR
jgi:hypothetical protein